MGPVLGGDDEGHGRREGPTREGEVSRGEGGVAILSICGPYGFSVLCCRVTPSL